MKNWKLLLLYGGLLLLVAAMAVYVARIVSCYPSVAIYSQFSPDQAKGFREACQLNSSIVTQFGTFLILFIPGVILFSTYWLITRPRVKNRRIGQLSGFLLFLMFDSLLVMFFGLLELSAPWCKQWSGRLGGGSNRRAWFFVLSGCPGALALETVGIAAFPGGIHRSCGVCPSWR